jgi:hypothetical protein
VLRVGGRRARLSSPATRPDTGIGGAQLHPLAPRVQPQLATPGSTPARS